MTYEPPIQLSLENRCPISNPTPQFSCYSTNIPFSSTFPGVLCVSYNTFPIPSMHAYVHGLEFTLTLGTYRMSRQDMQAAIIMNTAKPQAGSMKQWTASTRLRGAPMPTRITTMYMVMLTKRESLMQKYLTFLLSQARNSPNTTSSPLYTQSAPIR